MKRTILLLFVAAFLVVNLMAGGCQTSSKPKKHNPYDKNFQREVAEDPFPRADGR